MPKPKIEQRFELIKQNHKKYLEKQMVSHLEFTNNLDKAELVKQYAQSIEDFREDKERYLDKAVAQPSTLSKLGNGFLAALAGMGVAGGAYFSQQGNPFVLEPPQSSAVGAILSAGLGSGVSYLVYQAFNEQNPAAADTAAFQQALKKAGFTNEKYAELSAEIVKLFHYRECLLLGLKDSADINVRLEFKQKFKISDDRALDSAIEVYFLDQLSELFNRSFKDVYQIQNQEIAQDAEQNKMLSWIKSFFESPAERAKFTQKLQIEFMSKCIGFLEDEMAEKTFIAKYPLAIQSILGFMAGIIALSITAPFIGGLLGLATATIGFAVGVQAAQWALEDWDDIKFKRSKENRAAIKTTIDYVQKEVNALKNKIKNVVQTNKNDIELLKKYEALDAGTGWLDYLNIWGTVNEVVAMGSGSAWIREHAARYQHSKLIEIDLAEQHRKIINKAHKQTTELNAELMNYLQGKKSSLKGYKLNQFISDTKKYLANAEHQEFITKFEMVEKIKQQVLDIVAEVPSTIEHPLPQALIDFYILPVAQGGLGGLSNELVQVRSLAPKLREEQKIAAKHPHYALLSTAQRLNTALANATDSTKPYYRMEHAYILKGDSDYRDMLGLSIDDLATRVEGKINAENIHKYLEHSFDFLLSLATRKVNTEASKSEHSFELRDEYLLYRTLLIKQLAILSDPNSARFEPRVRRAIESFVEQKMQLSARTVFDDIINQSLYFDKPNVDNKILDPLGQEIATDSLAQIADAIRVNIAYCSRPLTAKSLIEAEANIFVNDKKNQANVLFFDKKYAKQLRAEATTDYVTKLKLAIHATKNFINEIAKRQVLKESGALEWYFVNLQQEIDALITQIIAQDQRLSGKSGTIDENGTPIVSADESCQNPYLKESQEYLLKFKQQLVSKVEQIRPELSDDEDSKRRFGNFEYASPLLSDSWELIDIDDPTQQEPKASFIYALETYAENLARERQVEWCGFFKGYLSYDRASKQKAALDLLNMLKGLTENKPLSQTQVEVLDLDNIYKCGRLGAVVSNGFKGCDVKSFAELFRDVIQVEPDNVPVF